MTKRTDSDSHWYQVKTTVSIKNMIHSLAAAITSLYVVSGVKHDIVSIYYFFSLINTTHTNRKYCIKEMSISTDFLLYYRCYWFLKLSMLLPSAAVCQPVVWLPLVSLLLRFEFWKKENGCHLHFNRLISSILLSSRHAVTVLGISSVK
jgi:hypothetical protein